MRCLPWCWPCGADAAGPTERRRSEAEQDPGGSILPHPTGGHPTPHLTSPVLTAVDVRAPTAERPGVGLEPVLGACLADLTPRFGEPAGSGAERVDGDGGLDDLAAEIEQAGAVWALAGAVLNGSRVVLPDL